MVGRRQSQEKVLVRGAFDNNQKQCSLFSVDPHSRGVAVPLWRHDGCTKGDLASPMRVLYTVHYIQYTIHLIVRCKQHDRVDVVLFSGRLSVSSFFRGCVRLLGRTVVPHSGSCLLRLFFNFV